MLLAVVLIAGCDGELDIKPKQSISSGVALGDADAVQAALVGAYDEFTNGDLMNGDFHMHADLLADDGELFWNGSFIGPRQIFNKSILITNGEVSEIWLESYETINRANLVLSALDVVDAGDAGRVEGEAKFIRGVTYFFLVRFFGKDWNDGDPNSNAGVPLITTPTSSIDASAEVSRATVGAVYAQVLSDLTDAANLLPTSNGFFATSHAANGFLSRVYLQQGDFANAITTAGSVISSGAFGLTSNYADAFNSTSNTSEDIFASQVSAQDGANGLNTFYAPPENGGRGDIDITNVHLALYDASDDRLNMFYNDQAGAQRTGKWTDATGNDNVNVLRLAEMYLNRGEAIARTQGLVQGAIDDLNATRVRAGLTMATLGDFASQQELIDEFLLERRRELAFEGFTLGDLKRTQGTLTNSGLAWNADALVFPIPDREMDINPNLVQNPGY